MVEERPNLILALAALVTTGFFLFQVWPGSRVTNPLPEEKVNINTAGMNELLALPRIGSARAGKILKLRETGKLDQGRLEAAFGRSTFAGMSSKIRF